jgi:hypothetical protein
MKEVKFWAKVFALGIEPEKALFPVYETWQVSMATSPSPTPYKLNCSKQIVHWATSSSKFNGSGTCGISVSEYFYILEYKSSCLYLAFWVCRIVFVCHSKICI